MIFPSLRIMSRFSLLSILGRPAMPSYITRGPGATTLYCSRVIADSGEYKWKWKQYPITARRLICCSSGLRHLALSEGLWNNITVSAQRKPSVNGIYVLRLLVNVLPCSNTWYVKKNGSHKRNVVVWRSNLCEGILMDLYDTRLFWNCNRDNLISMKTENLPLRLWLTI